MPFDALTLECFVAVAQELSFTKAAEKVNRSQSAVSQQVAKLENQIGKPLFKRGKQFTLTYEGEILLSYARKIIKLNREAMDRFKQPDLHGEVKFGLPEDFASVFLSDVLSEYASLHPRVMLKVECDLTLNLYSRFKRKDFDLVLVKMNKPEDFPNGIDVWSEPLEWVGNAELFNNPLVPLVLSPPPCVYRSRAINSLDNINRSWRIVFSSHSFAGTIAAVKASMGVTVLPRNMIPKGLEVVRVCDDIPQLDDTHISLLKHDPSNIAVNSLETFVMERLHP